MSKINSLLILLFCFQDVAVSAQEVVSQEVVSQEVVAERSSRAGIEFFEAKIRPVLVKQCYECHSTDADEGGLRVDSRRAIREGGERGPAVVPKQTAASVLLAAIEHADPDLKMPPKQPRLSNAVVADFRKWIAMGAPDPRDADPSGDEGRTQDGASPVGEHWAYQPPTRSEPPLVNANGWPRHDLDRFVWAALADKGMKPSADAKPPTLLRRVHFDLVGLPPTPEDLARFSAAMESDGAEEALADVVDALLESPQFGVRWGRHWLDVARFGESSGGESNISFPYAWRYRDYVIDAVNEDLPNNQFLTEQIAGDLLPYDDDAQRARLLTATGFLAVGTKNLGENNDLQFLADVVDEQIDTLSRSVLASSVACARCHDHKFDPFAMEDYYALAGIFASTKTYFGTYTSPANNRGGDPLVLPRTSGQKIYHRSLTAKKFAELKSKFAELDAVRTEINASQSARFAGLKPKKIFTLREVLANTWRIGGVEGKLETLDANGKALPLAMGVLDADTILDVPLFARGEISRPGAIIPRGVPEVMSIGISTTIPEKQSGRLQLAKWLTHQQHPLTSRVFVNRVWKHLFGRGMVSTVDDFGTTGSVPSHPDLLDTLAVDFVEDRWSLKRLVRSIVLSRTYRQASTYDANAFQTDPENRLIWRMPKRRLEAEAIRDAMLFASGELDPSRPAGSLVATAIGDRPISLIGLNKKLPKDLDGATYRSVYLPVIRDRLPSVLELFDFADPSFVSGDRETTNVPLQALYLMNSSFVQDRARALAARLENESGNDRERVKRAFAICFARHPESDEMKRSLSYLKNEITLDDRSLTMLSFCQALMSTAEFRNLD